MTVDEPKGFLKFLPHWREAAIWALIAAFLLELGINVMSRNTLWHRVTEMEESVKSLQHSRELEELKTRSQLDQLLQKTEDNKQELDQIDEEVKKKK